MSSETAPVKKKKAADVDVLRCLDPGCRGMLAFEVTAENVLNPRPALDGAPGRCDALLSRARHVGGRNVVEEVRDAKGALRHAVTRFEPA